jgi:hypothetical protein
MLPRWKTADPKEKPKTKRLNEGTTNEVLLPPKAVYVGLLKDPKKHQEQSHPVPLFPGELPSRKDYYFWIKTPHPASGLGQSLGYEYLSDYDWEPLQKSTDKKIVKLHRRFKGKADRYVEFRGEIQSTVLLSEMPRNIEVMHDKGRCASGQIILQDLGTYAFQAERMDPSLAFYYIKKQLFRELTTFYQKNENERVEHIRNYCTVVGTTDRHHLGANSYVLVAVKDIPVGTFLGEYLGEVMVEDQIEKTAIARTVGLNIAGLEYGMTERAFKKLGQLWPKSGLAINATAKRNEFAFMNDPSGYQDVNGNDLDANVVVFQYWINGRPKLGVIAIKKIIEDDELLWRYGPGYWHYQYNLCEQTTNEEIARLKQRNQRLLMRLARTPTGTGVEELRRAEEEIEQWRRRYLACEEERKDLREKHEKQQKENQELEEKCEGLEKEKENLEDKYEECERMRRKRQERPCETLEEDYNTLMDRLSKLQAAYDLMRQEYYAVIMAHTTQMTTMAKTQNDMVEQYRAQIRTLKNAEATLIDELQRCKKDLEILKQTPMQISPEMLTNIRLDVLKTIMWLNGLAEKMATFKQANQQTWDYLGEAANIAITTAFKQFIDSTVGVVSKLQNIVTYIDTGVRAMEITEKLGKLDIAEKCNN